MGIHPLLIFIFLRLLKTPVIQCQCAQNMEILLSP
nr:MAG TPA: hypothetical protein [Caudoviricetes sp.]